MLEWAECGILPSNYSYSLFTSCGRPTLQQMGLFMPGTWSRSLLLLAAFGLVGACDELAPPPQKTAPVVVAPVKKKAVVAAPAVAPVVKKKPATVDIDFGNDGGGGGGWQG
ncbi:MAG: hypothetical protein WAT35_01165 [Tabrizicola sp.]|uniref:hypothetical protein n=1 Tax=Tabrizicola sp. TaxID=2005166 RepID=UPI003BB03393